MNQFSFEQNLHWLIFMSAGELSKLSHIKNLNTRYCFGQDSFYYVRINQKNNFISHTVKFPPEILQPPQSDYQLARVNWYKDTLNQGISDYILSQIYLAPKDSGIKSIDYIVPQIRENADILSVKSVFQSIVKASLPVVKDENNGRVINEDELRSNFKSTTDEIVESAFDFEWEFDHYLKRHFEL